MWWGNLGGRTNRWGIPFREHTGNSRPKAYETAAQTTAAWLRPHRTINQIFLLSRSDKHTPRRRRARFLSFLKRPLPSRPDAIVNWGARPPNSKSGKNHLTSSEVLRNNRAGKRTFAILAKSFDATSHLEVFDTGR